MSRKPRRRGPIDLSDCHIARLSVTPQREGAFDGARLQVVFHDSTPNLLIAEAIYRIAAITASLLMDDRDGDWEVLALMPSRYMAGSVIVWGRRVFQPNAGTAETLMRNVRDKIIISKKGSNHE